MSGTTISGSYSTGILVSNPAYNPVLVTGTITVSSGIALNGQGGVVWTVTNTGLIAGYQTGVLLSAGGVTNQSSGRIFATGSDANGVQAATVTNSGLISATGYGVLGASAVYNSANAIIAAGNDGVGLSSGGLVNAGTISASGTYGTGIVLQSGANVTNQSGGVITATGLGINAGSGTGSVVNDGRIEGSYYGISRGAAVTNHAGGTITGDKAGLNLAVSVVNAGSIAATGAGSTGIVLQAGGAVSNAASGSISGTGYGIKATAGTATIENAGYVGGAKDAIIFASDSDSRLIVDPGASFTGIVDGGLGSSSILELAGTTAGVISGLGSTYVDFAQIVTDSGSDWSLSGANTIGAGVVLAGPGPIGLGANAALTVDGTIAAGQTIAFSGSDAALTLSASASMSGAVTGFAAGDTIDLSGVDPATVTYAAGVLDYTAAGGGAQSFALSLQAGSIRAVSDGTGGADVEIACFAAGTRLASPNGPVAVERLRPGDTVLTLSGAVRPVQWIGHRRIDCTVHPWPEKVQPIRIRAGAFGDGLPSRDLRLSPDHAVLLDDALVPIRFLVNHASIVAETECRSITYFHVELESHDILLAEDLPVESYLDTGNRGMFENADAPLLLHPDFSAGQQRREAESCRELVTEASRLAAFWDRLAARAPAIGYHLPPAPETTTDPGLHLTVSGRRIRPINRNGDRYVFALPRNAGAVRLVSRRMIPNARKPWLDDRRRLGVAVTRLTLRSPDWIQPVPLDHPALVSGWWDVETAGRAMWRWTNGDAALPLDGAACLLEIHVSGGAAYPIEAEVPQREGAAARRPVRQAARIAAA